MGITTEGLSVIAANMTGSSLPFKTAIGLSGVVFSDDQTTLGSETDRNLITDNDLSTTKEVTFIANFSPPELSGLIMKEFGSFTSGNVMTNRQALTGSLVFDGEQELQTQDTFKFSISGG